MLGKSLWVLLTTVSWVFKYARGPEKMTPEKMSPGLCNDQRRKYPYKQFIVQDKNPQM